MAKYGQALQKLIPPGANDPRIKARIGILHVDASNSESLYRYFNGPSGGVESHFHIPKVNQIEQYRDTAYEADANLKANAFAIAVETQGYANEIWNDKQLTDIKDLMLWAKKVHGIPLRMVKTWDDPVGGWGYHIQFGAPGPWTPVAKSCPGPYRIAQFNEILVPWMNKVGTVTEDDMFGKDDSDRLIKVEKAVVRLEKSLTTFRRSELKRDKDAKAAAAKRFNLTDKQLDEILAAVDGE